jgi:glycosyltransferase involved in cell wall biosynthesis
MPMFSVLLPTHNKAEFLPYAIESILNQQEQDWELIISNNASTDGTDEILAEVKDPRIKISRSDEKLKLTDNWNRAYNMATGNYVLMMGDDDYLLPNNLSEFRKTIEKFPLDKLFYSNLASYFIDKRRLEYVEDTGEIVPESWQKHLHWMFAYAYQMYPPSVIFERKFMEQNKGSDGQAYQCAFPDFYLHSLLAIRNGRTIHVKKTLCVAGRSVKSLSIQQASAENRIKAFGENRYDGESMLPIDTFVNGFYGSIIRLKEVCPVELNEFQIDTKRYYTSAASQMCDSALLFLFKKGWGSDEFKASVRDLKIVLKEMPLKMKLVDFPFKLIKRLMNQYSPEAVRYGVIRPIFFRAQGMVLPQITNFKDGHKINDCVPFFEEGD